MAFKIKSTKVNRRYLYKCIKAQQDKLNQLFDLHNGMTQQRHRLEARVKELSTQLYDRPVDSIYKTEIVGSARGTAVFGEEAHGTETVQVG